MIEGIGKFNSTYTILFVIVLIYRKNIINNAPQIHMYMYCTIYYMYKFKCKCMHHHHTA